MIPILVWTAAGAYAARSVVSPRLFHRTWSFSILSFLILVDSSCRQQNVGNKFFLAALSIINFAICLLLSPAQVLLKSGSSPSYKSPSIWTPSKSCKIKVDIVAVHGLGSRPESAWAHRDENAFNWLRDELPDAVGARVIVPYHNTQYESRSLLLSVDELGSELLDAVEIRRSELSETERRTRPVIFLGYSFGGIIVKKALVLNSIREVVRIDMIGCLFLGTPHRGSKFAFLGKMVSLLGHWSGSSTSLLQAIEKGSPGNASLHEDFLRGYSTLDQRLVNCYETMPEYLGPFALTQASRSFHSQHQLTVKVVSREDARLDVGKQVSINSNHRELRRFKEKSDSYEQLMDHMKRLVEEVQRSTTIRKHVSDEISRRENEFLEKIPHAADASFDDQGQLAGFCAPGTREQLLQDISDWAHASGGDRGFWLQGMAGTGKSTVARTIAERFHHQSFNVGSFFFKRQRGDRSNARRFVPTVLRQLATQPDLRPFLLDAWDSNPGISRKTLQHQWHLLIQKPLASAEHKTIILVLDALDECEKNSLGQDEMFGLLSDEANFVDLNMRMFVTSRPQETQVLAQHKVFFLHDIKEEVIRRDIRLFLELRFSEFNARTSRARDFPKPHHIEALVQRSTPLFIAAVTSFRFIVYDDFDMESRFQLLLGNMQGSRPEEQLDQMYHVIIKEVVTRGTNAISDIEIVQRNIDRYREIVGSVLVLMDGLSCDELAALLSRPPSLVRDFLKAFRSVLDTPEHPDHVRFFHSSFHDFAVDEERVMKASSHEAESELDPAAFTIDEERAHYDLFLLCLNLMEGLSSDSARTGLRKNMFNLNAPAALAVDITPSERDGAISAELRYACIHWIDHFSAACRTDGLMDFAADAKKFLGYSHQGIEKAPMQVYSSALLFAPDKSVVKRSFKSHIPSWIQKRPAIDEPWGASLLKLDDPKARSRIWEMKFSSDSTLIASIDRDGYFLVWEVATGTIIFRAMGHGRQVWSSMDLSVNDVAAYCDGSDAISLWNLRNRQDLHRLEGPHGSPYSVVFSPDGKTLASANKTQVVVLWDVATGSCLQVLHNSERPIAQIAFDQDSDLLAISSSKENHAATAIWRYESQWRLDHEVSNTDHEVVNTDPEQEVPEMKQRCDQIIFAGKYLVRMSNLERVSRYWHPRVHLLEIWDPDERCFRGTYLQRDPGIEGNRGHRRAVFLSDKKHIVAASETGELVPILLGESSESASELPYSRFEHSKKTGEIFLSSHGNLIAGLKYDQLKIWDTSTGKLRCKIPLNDEYVDSAAFSPCGTILATPPGRKGSMQLWEVSSLLQTLPRSPGEILCLARSDDGGKIATVRAKDSIEIKCIDSCPENTSRKLKGRLSNLRRLVFSPEGRYLAVISSRGFDIWDLTNITTEDPTRSVLFEEVELGKTPEFAFSPDGNVVAYDGGKLLATLTEVESGRTIFQYQELDRSFESLRLCFISAQGSEPDLCIFALQKSGFAPRQPVDETDESGTTGDQRWQNTPKRTTLLKLDLVEETLAYLGEIMTTNTLWRIEALPSAQALTTIDRTHKIQIWNMNNMDELQSLVLPFYSRELRYCHEGECMLLDFGTISREHSGGRSDFVCSCRNIPVVFKGEWLYWAGKPFLWIPPSHRLGNFAAPVRKNRVLIPKNSGFVILELGEGLASVLRGQTAKVTALARAPDSQDTVEEDETLPIAKVWPITHRSDNPNDNYY